MGQEAQIGGGSLQQRAEQAVTNVGDKRSLFVFCRIGDTDFQTNEQTSKSPLRYFPYILLILKLKTHMLLFELHRTKICCQFIYSNYKAGLQEFFFNWPELFNNI